jgi:acylphosphatase
MICRRSFVSGRVQGVFYRATCARKAQSLGLSGFARNLADGRVEVLACGDAAAVDAFVAWLWEGSPASKVAMSPRRPMAALQRRPLRRDAAGLHDPGHPRRSSASTG